MKQYEALVSKVFYFALSTISLAMLGAFSFISSTISLPKNYSTLYATAYELVVMARSTRMLVFILFHIIVVMICSSKSSFESDLDADEVLVVTHKLHDLETKEEVFYGDKCDKSVGEFQGDGDEDDFNGVSYDADDESFEIEEDEEGHGDLRGRIEEFIGNVTRTWKEELLKEKKVLCLVEDTESLYMLVPYDMV